MCYSINDLGTTGLLYKGQNFRWVNNLSVFIKKEKTPKNMERKDGVMYS